MLFSFLQAKNAIPSLPLRLKRRGPPHTHAKTDEATFIVAN
jgi:hypothetical protein